MQKFALPVACLVIGLVMAVLGQWVVAALFLAAAFVFGVFQSLAATGQARVKDPVDQMDPTSRSLFISIRKITGEIEALIEKKKDSYAVQLVGKEALAEARRVQDEMGHALVLRSELAKNLRVLRAGSEEAKVAEEELGMDHRASVEETIAKIEESARAAKTSLEEIRTRLTASVAIEKVGAADSDGLRDSLSRLKALNSSYDEVEDLLRNE